MTTLEDKIFTLKQNNLMKKMKEIYFLNHLISDSDLQTDLHQAHNT